MAVSSCSSLRSTVLNRRSFVSAAALTLASSFALAGCSQSSAGDTAGSASGVSGSAAGAVAASEEDTGVAIAAPSNSGQLRLKGAQIVSEAGEPVQLRGVSTHGLAWFPQYVNQEFFDELRTVWGANLVRLALYTAESGGYCTDGNQEELMQLIDNGVAYATQADLYVIVDWHVLHDLTPLEYQDQAVEFFRTVSQKYAGNNNVIYEICNEPNGSTTWEDVKSYAEVVIPVIRENAPDALVVVGTPTWSQDVDKAGDNPLDFENVLYTLHFYAATHGDYLRDRMARAVEGGLPVFVTEFGICDSSGNGAIDYDSANAWIDLMDSMGISYACWCLSNKDESASIFKADCSKSSGFAASDLSAEGLWLVDVLDSPGFSD